MRKIAKLRHMKKPCIDYTTLNPHHTYIGKARIKTLGTFWSKDKDCLSQHGAANK